MDDIRFYDFEFNLLHIEHKIVSVNWTLYFNDIGSFELHLPHSPRLKKLFDNKYTVAVQGNLQAIITGRQCVKNECVFYGKTVNWLLSKRVCLPFKLSETEISHDVESIARYAAEEGFGDLISDGVLTFGERVVAEGELPSDGYNFWRNTANSCSDVIKDCLDDGKLGHELRFDVQSKQWIFSVLPYRENNIILSEANRNAYENTYSSDLQSAAYGGYYEVPSYTEEDKETGEITEYEAEWKHISAPDAPSGIYYWEEVLSGESASEARTSLKSKKIKEEFTSKVRKLKFNIDYMLGDFVRIQTDFPEISATNKCQIIGVNLWHEHNNEGAEPILQQEG